MNPGSELKVELPGNRALSVSWGSSSHGRQIYYECFHSGQIKKNMLSSKKSLIKIIRDFLHLVNPFLINVHQKLIEFERSELLPPV